jgi:hypothetical protein
MRGEWIQPGGGPGAGEQRTDDMYIGIGTLLIIIILLIILL